MALVVFDMGRRIETPVTRPHQRVNATQASAAVRPVQATDQPGTGPNDAALAAYAQRDEKEPDAVAYVHDIMHRAVRTLSPDTTLKQAWEIFRLTGYHHLPVINEQRQILAMFSDQDLLPALVRQPASSLDVFWRSNVMTLAVRPVLCVLQNTDIRQSSNLLYEYNIGALPVLNDDHELCGIVTRSDILRLLSHYGPMELWA